jgi:hypothetical protein
MIGVRAIALGLSLAGNLFIATRLFAGGAPDPRTAPQQTLPGAAAPVRAARSVPPPRLGDPTCERLTRVQGELERIKAGLRRVQPAEQQFEATAASAPELEQTLRREAGLDAAIPVSCRTQVCRIEVRGDGGVDMRLVRRIEDNVWVRRHLRGVTLGRGGYFLAMSDEEAFGADLLLALVKDYYASGAIERCRAGAPEAGEVAARLKLMPADDLQNTGDRSAVLVEVHGAGAATAFGRCLYETLVQAAGTREFPERVSSALFENVGLWPPEKQERYRHRTSGE